MKTKWTTYYNGAQTTFRVNDDPKNLELVERFYKDEFKRPNRIKVELWGDIHTGDIYIKLSDDWGPEGVEDWWLPKEPKEAVFLDRKFYN